ncbi:MAG: iron-containing alcohol dehydrogenase family protein [Cyanobacteria bacterium SID2]|nr:iron-containing alcohol dehydrogenase family protein [Cyanobacteria bacterium SID2]MBP0002198.1 iron-containing alcohol dehydrogenase family protein [Cyanobacteria bacterium SBC]
MADSATTRSTTVLSLNVAPAQTLRGDGILARAAAQIARLGQHPLLVTGDRTLDLVRSHIQPPLQQEQLAVAIARYGSDCDEAGLDAMAADARSHEADVIVGVGGGKALDAAKLLADRCQLPVVTIPTSAATCAAWTALSNVYTPEGAFLYDVALPKCPDLLVLDYELIRTAPQRTLVAGIGDALAKWYEASVSSGNSDRTLIVAAVQQARVLRDLLLQKSALALAEPGGSTWREVVDATVLLAGVIGGLGGAQCRTVAAHAVHNALTHLSPNRQTIHGEKVAFGILVQLRLEELVQQNQLAAAARQQLLKFYGEIGLPKTLAELGMERVSVLELHHAAQLACEADSDIHHLPFPVEPAQVAAAMVSTTATCLSCGVSVDRSPSKT